MAQPPSELEIMGRKLFIGLRSVVQKAVAKGVASVAEDVRDVVAEGEGRLGKFIAGCEEIARQGRSDPPPPVPPPAETTRQTPKAKKRSRGGRR